MPALLLALLLPAAVHAASRDDRPATVTVWLKGDPPDWRGAFDEFDRRFNDGIGWSTTGNRNGVLAWGASYHMMAFMEMYRATSDTLYLRRLTEHFDRVLAQRDDVLGMSDAYAGRPLAGWGAPGYNRDARKWHVYIVHTGMIALGATEFVREVQHNPALQREFGTSASLYRTRIAECIADTDPYWRKGLDASEGYYESPVLGLLPLNQSNAMGIVLLEMYHATGDAAYRDKAERLAHFFHNRIRRPAPGLVDWAYWPKADGQTTGSEDISHASINVDFAARCAVAGIVFTHDDIAAMANTWLRRVCRADGTWAAYIDGRGDGNRFMPASGARWLSLCRALNEPLRGKLIAATAQALRAKPIQSTPGLLGLARFMRYAAPHRPMVHTPK